MREIKFRGKRIDNGDWIFGNFIFDEEWQKAYISYPKKGAVYITLKSDVVDAKTVGQFTGLLDKEKKEIYEGDILALIEPKVDGKQTEFGRVEVKFGEYSTEDIDFGDISIGFYVEGHHGYRRKDGSKDIHEKVDSVLRCKKWEIIGNIYENQELLGVK